ncbi:tyrosinase family protein [Rhizobium leguminosarum]|uniref:tyrosinase family protein n=1 Tax=Rhizobium TaxID=379 RepID=UPI0013EEB969|nr:tyrosinase family protein [Rhizobium leguminosarum]
MLPAIKRRDFLAVALATASSGLTNLAISSSAFASGAAITRPSTRSKAGENALAQYRAGVKLMKSRSEANPIDPRGWTFQGLIHGILSRGSKQGFIATVFGNAPETDPDRRLAVACWATCPHGSIEFLPWHRIYVYFFERIVRQAVEEATGETDFVLPYWNYSADEDSLILPAAFREIVDGSPLGNALFNIARDAEINGLFAAPKPLPAEDVALAALEEAVFEATNSASGFSASLEMSPHGPIHVDIGGTDNIGLGVGDMASPSTAGRDPIFWMHHANIDRLWDSWLKSGGETVESYKDRPWYNKKWSFVDETGARQDISLADFVALTNGQPIAYEAYENIARRQQLVAVASTPTTFKSESADPMPLSSTGNSIALKSEGQSLVAPSTTIESARVVIERLAVRSEVGTVFDVFLNLPDGKPDRSRLIGSFTLFGLAMEGMVHETRMVFDITKKAKEMQANGSWPAEPTVTILPRDKFIGEPATIGSVTLVLE